MRHRLALALLAVTLAFAGVAVRPPDVSGQDLLIPMDKAQGDHLKAYGVVYRALQRGRPVDWLLNYRGGSFLTAATPTLKQDLRTRGVSFQLLSGAETAQIIATVENPDKNMAVMRLEEAPRLAVYAPEQALPWDDAVRMALEYAGVPYDMIYDRAVLQGKLKKYDWLHLHHEDFTGQFGKFYQYRNQSWYIKQQRKARRAARELGFRKVSKLKLAVAEKIRSWVKSGGFLFAMCSGTDTFDLALAAHNTDIVPAVYDGDAVDPNALEELDFSYTLAFEDFRPFFDPSRYEHSNIDARPPPPALRDPALDYFTLFEFSAKWDPVPTMLTQDHVATIKGFLGQTTAFHKDVLKEDVVVLAKSPNRDAVKYIHGPLGRGSFTFYAGHDPEDYQHFVGDPHTDLSLHPNSPGYRLILNNILFPAAEKKKQKT